MAPRGHLRYRYPPAFLARLAWALILGRRRSFADDAFALCRTMAPPPLVEGLDGVPRQGKFVAVCNHYYSRSFPSWWTPVVLTAQVRRVRPTAAGDVCWVISEAWTYRDPLRSHLLTPLSRWAFHRLARVYSMVPMPPMPPRAHEAQARSRAVRSVLALARGRGSVMIGLAPEGRDGPHAHLIRPPSGAGRFLLHLAAAGIPFLPVGVHEQGAQLVLRFGPPFLLQAPPALPRAERDPWACLQVMCAIGRLLPPHLWGDYCDSLMNSRTY